LRPCCAPGRAFVNHISGCREFFFSLLQIFSGSVQIALPFGKIRCRPGCSKGWGSHEKRQAESQACEQAGFSVCEKMARGRFLFFHETHISI
jgi:hypothetical protein